ncbi:hypothetical protein KKB69_02150 [Patescibacteria group bacterium]|nr:hypothetical protein [Patescibacteria group bacterium]
MATLSTNYIASALKRGEKEEFIRRSLRMQGISEADINKAFEEIKKGGGNNFQASETGEKNFLEPRVNVNIQRAPIYAQPKPSESRLQYAPKRSFKMLWLVVLIIVLIAVGVAGYLYFDRIYNFVFKPQVESFGDGAAAPEVNSTAQDSLEILTVITSTIATSSATATPESLEGQILSAEVSVRAEDPNLLKIDAIRQGQLFLAEQFNINGVYPATYFVAGDSGAFYCYRKEGIHYILGVVLQEDSEVLENDLDGDYYCGDVIKKCADPVYCVGP